MPTTPCAEGVSHRFVHGARVRRAVCPPDLCGVHSLQSISVCKGSRRWRARRLLTVKHATTAHLLARPRLTSTHPPHHQSLTCATAW
eukprot:1784688-Prymnesium_polylepis.1